MKQDGISGNLLETLTDFLKDRKQRVVLNEQNSSWANTEAGVPQGSILGLLLLLIYVSDLPDNLSTDVKLFADDISLFSVVHDIAIYAQVSEKKLQSHDQIVCIELEMHLIFPISM